MTVENFVRNFELLTNTQVGINQLRTLVLKLAAKGLIVRQQDEEGNASKDLATLSHSEVGELFSTDSREIREYPSNWAEARFPNIGKWIGGNGFPTAEQGHKNLGILFCKVSDMNLASNSKFILETINTIDTKTAIRLKVTVLSEGTVVFPKIGGAIATNKRRIICKPTVVDNNCMGIKPSSAIDSEWLFLLLSSIDMTQYQSGTSIPSLSQRVLDQIPLGIPPLKEQKRIVSKVNELLLLCDELETNLLNQDDLRSAARKSAVDALSTAQTSEELQIAWERIQQNWEVIANTPESIESLRNLILSIAISGNLTKDAHPEDSVEGLLENVRKFIDPYPEISDERFAVPSNWKWVSLASVAEHQLGKMLHTAKMKGLRRQYLRSVNVRPDGTINLTDLNEMLIPESELEKYSVLKGDLFINEGGDVGRNAIFNLEIEFELAFQNQLHRLRPVCGIESRYIQFVLRQAKSQGVISQMSSGVTIQHFSASALRKFAIPLPPLSEQKLIVEKVNHLMKFCDELELRILEMNNIAEKFARSVVSAT
jgi:type I restriction enzyme S subunit